MRIETNISLVSLRPPRLQDAAFRQGEDWNNRRCWTIQLSERQLPAGQKVIRGPGVYQIGDRPPLLVGKDNDYSLPGRPLTFDFATLPLRDAEALDLGRRFRDVILRRGVFTDTPAPDVATYRTFLGDVFKSEAAEIRRSIRAGEFFVYNGSPTPLYSIKPRPEEAFVDVNQYTQNDHFITTFIEKALKAGITRDRIELHFKASTIEGFPYKESEEILKASVGRLGDVSRSTEFILRFRSSDPARIRTLAVDLLDVAEKHGITSTQRRLSSEAWLESDIRIVGIGSSIIDKRFADQWNQKPTLFRQVFLHYKIAGDGEMVKLYRRRRDDLIPNVWEDAYIVLIPAKLYEYID